MIFLFADDFVASLKKHSAIKEGVRKKAEMIAANPIGLEVPLKGNFRGCYSCTVHQNFLIIFFLLRDLPQIKGDDAKVLCADCAECANDTLKFVALGPHDQIRLISDKLRNAWTQNPTLSSYKMWLSKTLGVLPQTSTICLTIRTKSSIIKKLVMSGKPTFYSCW